MHPSKVVGYTLQPQNTFSKMKQQYSEKANTCWLISVHFMFCDSSGKSPLPPSEDCPPEDYPPRNLPTRKLPHPSKISPYEYNPLWKLPTVKITPRNLPPGKLSPMKIPPEKITLLHEILSPLNKKSGTHVKESMNFQTLKK